MRGAFTRWAVVIVAAVSALSIIALAYLQYQWIAELGTSERALLDASIERGIRNFREEFNSEVSRLVERTMRGQDRRIESFAARANQAITSTQHPAILKCVYLTGFNGKLLRSTAGGLVAAEWPAYLSGLHPGPERALGPPPRPFWNETPPAIGLPRAPRRGRRPGQHENGGPSPAEPPPPPPPPREEGGPPPDEEGPPPGRPGPRPPRARAAEPDLGQFIIFEFDSAYIRQTLLPELFAKHFGPDYELEVVSATDPAQRLFGFAIQHPDASAGFFEIHLENPEGRGRPDAPFESSRWVLQVKHQSGSLDQQVAGARHRNLGLAFAVLLLMGVSSAALVVWLRRSEELNRMQMDFVAGVSHELRTPLAVIRSAGENLADGVVANEKGIRNYGSLIRDEGRRLSNMVEQILRFAGVESGHAAPSLTKVQPAELVERALAESQAVLHGVQVERGVPSNLPAVMAEAAPLSHALQNLLSNAVKYGDGKWVRIEAAAQGQFVEFAVIDRGQGVSVADQKRVFDPFFRGERAIKDQIRGLGIGLSLVKRVAEAHGGSVSVRNEPQGGARFSLLIPAKT